MATDDALVGLVEAEVKKAGPDGLTKEALQAATALGTDDLREALEELVPERGDWLEGRFVHHEYLDEAGNGGLPIPTAATPSERPAGEPGDAEQPPGPLEDAEGLSGFRVTWETTAEFRSKDAHQAVEDAKTIVADAQQGILAKSPHLGISQNGVVVTQFAERRVWPPQT